jgi:hypothetical protein
MIAARIAAASTAADVAPATAATGNANTNTTLDGGAAMQRTAVAAAVAGLNAEFYPAAAEVVGAAWAFAAGRDMLYPFAGLVGEARSLKWRLMQEYVGALFKVAAVDSEVRLAKIKFKLSSRLLSAQLLHGCRRSLLRYCSLSDAWGCFEVCGCWRWQRWAQGRLMQQYRWTISKAAALENKLTVCLCYIHAVINSCC